MANPVPLYLSPNYERLAGDGPPDRMDVLREFATRGYVVIEPDFGDFDALADAAVRDLAGRYGAANRVQDGWQDSDAVRAIASHPEILDTLELLYGRKAFPFQTLNFEVGTQQKTHSDTIHFDSLPRGFMAGVWVALEDVDYDNGPLQYYPGSHRLHHFDLGELGGRDARTGGQQDGFSYSRFYEPAIAQLVSDQALEPEFGLLKKGQALIWSANLLHGGSPIKDQTRTRHSQVTHYFFDNCAYLTPLLGDQVAGYSLFRQPIDIRDGSVRTGTYGAEPIDARQVRRHSILRQVMRGLGRIGRKAA